MTSSYFKYSATVFWSYTIHLLSLKDCEFNYDLYLKRLLKGNDCKDIKDYYHNGISGEGRAVFKVGNLRRISGRNSVSQWNFKAINTANSKGG